MKRITGIVLSMLLIAAAPFSLPARAALPDRQPLALQVESPMGLTGSLPDLQAALAELSPVAYKILVVDENPADRTAYLDGLLASWGWPQADQMLLVLFPRANYDIRFALGADFQAKQVSVDQVLGLVRAEYLSRSQQGDAAGGLATLIRGVNRSMAPAGDDGWLSLSDPERLKIARELLNRHLASFKEETTPAQQRLREFRIEAMQVYPAVAGGYPLVLATYSVQPFSLETTAWMAGNGTLEEDWVAHKSQFLRIERVLGEFVIVTLATSP